MRTSRLVQNYLAVAAERDEWKRKHDVLLAAHASFVQEMETVIAAILAAARGDEKSECWTIRRYLDERDVFNEDIQSETRLIEEAAKYILALLRRSASPGTTEKET